MRLGSFFICCLAWLFAAAAADAEVDTEEIQLGAVLQLSGSQSQWGIDAQRGIETAVREINESGELRPRRLKIYYEDGKGDAGASVTALRRLLSLYVLPAFFTQATSVTMALQPLSNSERVVQMDVGSTTPSYRKEGDFTFRTAVTARQLAPAIAGLVRERGIAECGILHVDDDLGEGIKEVFSVKFHELGGKVRLTQSFNPGDADFRPQILRLKHAAIPCLVIAARYQNTGFILKQAREAQMRAQFFGEVYTVESPEVVKIAGSAAEDFLYIAPRFTAAGSQTAARFSRRFEQDYGSRPVQLSAQAYDAVLALAEAIKKCTRLSAECLKTKLASVQFDGASGWIKFDSTGDVETREVTKKTIRHGAFVELP